MPETGLFQRRSFLLFNKKVLLTNGSMLYGNITYQDDTIIQLETLIGSLAIEKNTIIRVVDQAVSVLDKDDQFIELNAELCMEWPNITEQKDPPNDADEWREIKNKVKYLER